MITILLLVGVLTLIYFIIIKPYNYWAKKGVLTGKIIPIFGDNLQMMLGKESMLDATQRMYNKLSDVRYIGSYQFMTPVLVLKSPELIKQICVKDFDHFLNHKPFIPDGVEELMSKNLFSLKGQTWKNMRSTLSPSFTSSKMKSMFVLICHNANLFVKHFLDKEEKLIELKFKDAFTRYATDVIASLAFGIHVDSLKNRENEFFMMGKNVTTFSLRTKLVFFLYLLTPKLASFLRLSIFDKKLTSFFMNIVKDTIKMREEQNIKRTDMLGLLIEARKGQQKLHIEPEIKESSFAVVEEYLEVKTTQQVLTDADIASQVFVFFIGGFDSVSSVMCFVAYELAANPDVQNKLIEEIDENRPADGPPSYETIANMTYLDMVVSETLRKWPIAVGTDRQVTKPYVIQPELPGEQPVHLDVGDSILISIIGIHRDPKYYENPDIFDPERFSLENRANIDPYSYLPFGVGPRNCIGSRFALLEIKAVIFYLLGNFEIVPVEKSQIPIKLDKKKMNVNAEDGFLFGLKRRN